MRQSQTITPVLRYPLLRFLWVLVGVATTATSTAAPFQAVVLPGSGDLTVVGNQKEYLGIGYYDWGPGWSGVNRSKSVTADDSSADFRFENQLRKNKANFTVEGSWSNSADRSIAFEATLTPEVDADLVMAQFPLSPGEAFAGGTAVATQEDGSTRELDIPLGRNSLGDAVRRLELTDARGRTTRLHFEAPTAIAVDRDDARLIIAKDRMEAGHGETLAFTLELPERLNFIPGLEAARQLPANDLSEWYVFDPADPIPADSEWQMRDWLEAPAGRHGRIRRDGADLIYNGEPIKLWGLNVSFAAAAPDADLADKRADFYAALGVNTVRLHKYGDGHGWAGILAEDSAVRFDPEKLDQMDYFVAALKKRGIYTKLSPVFIIDIGPADRERIPYADELGRGKRGRIDPGHGALYLSTELQDLLIDQIVNLLEHENPHTGLRYADDPAIAYVETYNEDSALFHGTPKVLARSPTLRTRAGEQFADWLKAKYEIEAAFLEAWGERALNAGLLKNQGVPQDESWAENRIYPVGNPWFYDPANLNTSQSPYRRRLLDTMAFLYELQNHVYERVGRAIRATGYEGELVTSNWQAGRMMSHFYNLHSDARAGTVDRHNYFGGGSHKGAFNAASMLADPGSGTLSSALQQVDDAAFMLSEWIHVFPNEWGAEGPALIGAYGMGLHGWDVSYAFQNRDQGTFSQALGRQAWDVTAPQFAGVLPAVSRQVLRGDVSEATEPHYRNVHIPSLDEQRVGFGSEVDQDWDNKAFTSDAFPAEAIAATKGLVRFTEAFTPTEAFDLSPFRDGDRIRSATGQLAWTKGQNPQDGHITIDTPGTQAVVGFAESRPVALSDATLRSDSRFAALYLSARSPEGRIAEDDALLLTAIARARNEGQVVVADSVVLSRGEIRKHKPVGPIRMEPVRARIELRRPGTPTVHLLDQAGRKTGRTLPVEDGAFTIDTAKTQSPYFLIEYK